MTVTHLVYGLRLSSNIPIPALPILQGTGPFDLQIWLKGPTQFFPALPFSPKAIFYTSPDSDRFGIPNLRVGLLNDGAYYGFLYSDGPRFAIDREGLNIWGDWPDGYLLEDVSTYLIGQVINFSLRLRGITPLHASSIAVGDRAIAVMGEPGAGKSTTAAAFARLGYPILSDDVAVLDDKGGKFLVQPGYPRVNLWPDSAKALFGSEDELPHITPTWGKRYLPLDRYGYCFQADPLPLSAIYVLEERDDELADPVVEGLAFGEALISLISNSYLNHLLNAHMRSQEFEVLGRVVTAVHVRRVHPTGDPSRVFELCEAIASDAMQLTKLDKKSK